MRPEQAADTSQHSEPDDSPTVTIVADLAPQPASAAPGGAGGPVRTPGRSFPSHDELVWQPRFAYVSATVVLSVLVLVTLPLWIVLFRLTDSATNNGAGPDVADVVTLCMMLMGGFLTGAAAWVIMIEMRARIRMIDALAEIRERELGPRTLSRVTPQPAHLAAIEAFNTLLSSFSRILASSRQLPAQVGMLVLAMALFIGATVLSLR